MIDILRNQIKTILFLSSYTFLFLIFILKNLNNQTLVYSLVGIILLSNIMLFISIKRCKSLADEFVKIKSVENINSVNSAYLVTYIIPFLAIDFTNITDLASLLLLFAVFAFLYVKSDMIYVNPTLNFIGYNLIEIKTTKDDKLILITKEKTKETLEKIKFRRLTNSILVG
ncbi:MAG: hypothetical protein Q8Q35_02660 [Nanoarchaeota archaeon]|nr:hypothetical protein [Nanoarchaeota archaeon]